MTGSEHSIGVPLVGQGGYPASKHAVLSLADVLRSELPEQIDISVLVPGLVASDIWRGLERRPRRFGGCGPADPLAQKVISRGMPLSSSPPSRSTAWRRERSSSPATTTLGATPTGATPRSRPRSTSPASGRSEVAYAVDDVIATLADSAPDGPTS